MKAALSIFFVLPAFLSAQNPPPPRAEPVNPGLRADEGNDFYQRGKNLYDSAQTSVDLDYRRELHLRAAQIFSDYLNRHPDHANAEPAWWYLGSSYYQAGRIDEAKRCFATLLNRYGQGKWAAAAAYTLAADHHNQGEYAFAAPLFERFAANAAKPEDRPKGNLFAANCYRLLGRDQKALAAYRKVVEDPAGGLYKDQAKLAMAQIELKAGKLQEALVSFEGVVSSDAAAKYRGEAALQAAITATRLNQTDLAEKYLRLIISTPGFDSVHADAQTALMENHFVKKEYAKVIELFRRSSLKAEGEKEALRLMIAARALVQLKEPAEASNLFREVERIVKPENDLAFQASYYRLHCFFQIEGRHLVDQIDGFLQIYQQSRPADTRIHTALLMKAETQFANKEIAAAAQTFSEIDASLISESNRPGFLYQRGWCLAEAGDHQGAIRSLTEFITKYPEDERIHLALAKRANAYGEADENTPAIADYDRLVADRDTPYDLAALAWLESARARRVEGNIEDMTLRYRGLLSKVEDLSDNLQAEAHYFIGWGLVKTNAPKDAADHLNKARELRPEAYSKHAGLLLTLSHFAAQEPDKLAAEIKLAIEGEYVDDIPKQALQWSGMQAYNAEDFATSALFLGLVADHEEPRQTPKEVWRYLAKALLETSKPDESLPAIANVLEVEDNPAWRADAVLDRARALYALERFAEARKSADEALALRPQGRTSAGLRIVSGDLHAQAGELGQSAADYLYVIQFHDDADLKPRAIHKYIQILEKQNNPAEAAKYRAQLAAEFPAWKAP